jgi:hypothetical protein
VGFGGGGAGVSSGSGFIAGGGLTGSCFGAGAEGASSSKIDLAHNADVQIAMNARHMIAEKRPMTFSLVFATLSQAFSGTK